MLSNLSSANNPVNENSVIQKAQNDYAEIDQRVDDLETEVAENTAALNQQGAQITSLANQVADVAANSTFDEISVNTVNSAGAGAIRIEPPLEIVRKVTAGNVCLLGTLEVDHVNFNDVRDNAASALSTANSAFHTASRAEQTAGNTATALNEYKDQIANSVSTGTANVSGGLTVGETINANDVVSTEGHFGSIETPSIDVKEIKSAGSLELPAQMSTPNDWFTITVPNGITATFSGSYQGEKYKFTVDKGNIEYDQDVLELIKDVSFKRSDNNVRIRVKADEALTYSFTDTGAVEPISIQKSTEAYADYSYAPQKARGTIYKGFDDRTSEIQMPGIFCASVIRADEQEYICSAAECQIISKKLFLPDEWDETGMISCTSGTDNQYVSNATKDGCVSPTWKTPVETAVDGVLSNTKCLITEKAVSEYNGTVDDGTDVTYPITNIGDDACVHGKLTAECLCGTCCVQGKAACFQEDVQADCFNGNCLIVCDIYGKAPVGGTSKVIVHDDTEFMNTTTFDENSCFKKKIVVDCDADFGEDVHIAGDLYVNGVSHVVDEETIETPSNEIMLRQNATTGLANTEISGILINKYNGTDSLTVGTDNTGTLRVGTGTGTSTSYATICHNQSENKWYVNDAEVTPVGVLQSYATKVEEDPYTVYTDAVFIAIDKTSLEPVLTRDEEVDMTQCGITYWDATNTKAKTASKIKYNNNGLDFDGKTCIEATQTTITDGTNTTTIDATKVKSKCGCFTDACVESTLTADVVCACTCVDTPLSVADCVKSRGNGEIEGNFLICGSLSVCGETAITGLMSDCIATTETSVNADYYIPMVEKNHQTQGANTVCTDGAFKYNPFSNTLTAENAKFTDTACITCACVGNECVNNLCIGTVVTNADATKSATYCVTNVTGNTDFAIPLYNKNITDVNSTKKAELSYANQATGPRYNPNTNTFCAHNFRATDYVTAGSAVVTTNVSSTFTAELPAGSNSSIGIYTACKDAQGNSTIFTTTLCGTDGKIYNNYGVCSTAQLNGLNTPVTSDFYSGNTSTGYMFLGCVEGSSAAYNDVTISGTLYVHEVFANNNPTIREETKFLATIRVQDTAGTISIYNAYVDNNSTKLKFTREVYGSITILRLYYQLASASTRTTLKIDYIGVGDQGTQVPPASYWQPSPGTIVVGSMTGTEIYTSVFPGSCVAYASCAGELRDHYNDGFSAYLYNGELSGVCKFNNNICLYNGNYNSYCALEGFSCVGVLCQGLGTYQYPSRWLSCSSSFRSIGIFNPALDINERGYIPTIPSMNAVDSNYKVLGFSLGAYRGRCEFEGAYFGVYRPYNNGGTVGCNCLRAVMNWHNCVCCSCTTEAGTWMCDSMIELIDTQGGQTINGGLTLHNSGSTSYLYADGICVKDTVALTSCDNIALSPSYDNTMIQNPQLYKSFIGSSTNGSDVWYNVISIRHRNGYSDGFLWGAKLYHPMTTTGHWFYQQQLNGTWTKSNQLIDSTGGQTIEGNLTLHTANNDAVFQADHIGSTCYGEVPVYGTALSDSFTGYPAGSTVPTSLIFECLRVKNLPAFMGGAIHFGYAYANSVNMTLPSGKVISTAGTAILNYPSSTLCSSWQQGHAIILSNGGFEVIEYTSADTEACGYHEVPYIGPVDASSLTINGMSIASNATYPISIVCGDHHILLSGNRSISIGHFSSAAQTSVAIGACSNALTGSSVAIGICSCSQTYAVAIGCDAKADYYSVAIGCAASSCSSYGTAIGNGAKNCVQNGIAIGAGANTSAYSSACVLVDERAGNRMRRSIICWMGGTKQCDLFCAIYCRFNFNYYSSDSQIYFSIIGQYGCTDVSEIKWDCGENPKNIDFYKDGGDRLTVYDGCTCAIPKAGWVQIINYAR